MENPRTESARSDDDGALIDELEEAPTQGGTRGGNLQRDIGSRAEEKGTPGDPDSVSRVRDKDKPEEADLPRYNER